MREEDVSIIRSSCWVDLYFINIHTANTHIQPHLHKVYNLILNSNKNLIYTLFISDPAEYIT